MTTHLTQDEDDLAVAILSWMPGDAEKAASMARDLVARGYGVVPTGVPTPTLASMQAEILEINHANGWYDTDRSTVEGHMLIVSEVAEATEAYRRWKLEDQTDPEWQRLAEKGVFVKPEGVGSEYADILVRLLDQCQRDDIDLQWEVDRKLAFNRTRGYRHGGRNI